MPRRFSFQVINQQEILVVALAADKGRARLQQQHIPGFQPDITEIARHSFATPRNRQNHGTVPVPEPGIPNGQAQDIRLRRQGCLDQPAFRTVLAEAGFVIVHRRHNAIDAQQV